MVLYSNTSTGAPKIQFLVQNFALYTTLEGKYPCTFFLLDSDVNQQSFVNKRNTVGYKNDNPENPVTSCLGLPKCVIFEKYRFFICHYL